MLKAGYGRHSHSHHDCMHLEPQLPSSDIPRNLKKNSGVTGYAMGYGDHAPKSNGARSTMELKVERFHIAPGSSRLDSLELKTTWSRMR